MNSRPDRLLIDGSALLADIYEEPGADDVRHILANPPPGGLAIHALNAFEVASSLTHRVLVSESEACKAAVPHGVVLMRDIHPVTWERAVAIKTRCRNLSLGDCFCIAFAENIGAAILTGDRMFREAGSTVEIMLFR